MITQIVHLFLGIINRTTVSNDNFLIRKFIASQINLAEKTPLRKHSTPQVVENTGTPTLRSENEPSGTSPSAPDTAPAFDRNLVSGLGTPVSAIKTSPTTRKSFEKAAANIHRIGTQMAPPPSSNPPKSALLSQFTPQALLIHSTDTQVFQKSCIVSLYQCTLCFSGKTNRWK